MTAGAVVLTIGMGAVLAAQVEAAVTLLRSTRRPLG
jgi:hypothetical protein